MSTDKIIGLVTTTRGFTFKLVSDLYGGPRFENQDVFSSKKADCRPEDEEAVSATLYAMAKRDVIRDVNTAIQEYAAITGTQPKNFPAILYAMTAEPVPTSLVVMPAPVSIETPVAASQQTEAEPPVTPDNGYVVAEKAPDSQPIPVPLLTHQKADPPHKAISERLKALGVTKPEMTAWTNFYFNFPDGKLTPDQYLTAFSAAEEWIKADSLASFRANLEKSKQAQPSDPTTQPSGDPFTEDPAVQEAMKQIGKKWPSWSPELSRVASLWCADQVKDAAALDAFLISCGIAAVTPPGKIESLLAISRHMALSSGAAIMAYSKQSGNPLGMLEADLSAKLGQPIRFAMELPLNAVSEAFEKINAEMKAGKK